MMFVVTPLVGLTPRLTDVSTVLFGICRLIGGVTTHAAGRVLVTSQRLCVSSGLGELGAMVASRVMLDRRRKTLVACTACHDRIHKERTARSLTS
ncbi:hypothetical protein [Kitasatospora sp. NPDC054795]